MKSTPARAHIAAGSPRRMGANKLLATINGKPLVRIVADAAAASKASPLVVLTGNDDDAAMDALSGLSVTNAFNPDHASGLASSLSVGLASVPADADGAVVLLADMPGVDSAIIDRLIDAFEPRTSATRRDASIFATRHHATDG